MSVVIKPILLGVHGNVEQRTHLEIAPICSSVTLIQSEDRNILIDSGFPIFSKKIIAGLKEVNLSVEEIDHVINTHYHFDHCGNNHLFPNADVSVGQLVWQYKKGEARYFHNEQDYEIPGVEIIYTPGHELRHWSVFVEDSEGVMWCVSGDAVGYLSIMNDQLPAFYSRREYLRSARLILEKSDKIIPGHGGIIEGKEKEQLLQRVIELIGKEELPLSEEE